MKELGHKLEAIRRGVHGKPCPFCGGQTYQLFLRPSCIADNATLLVRCHQCHHARTLDKDAHDILWM